MNKIKIRNSKFTADKINESSFDHTLDDDSHNFEIVILSEDEFTSMNFNKLRGYRIDILFLPKILMKYKDYKSWEYIKPSMGNNSKVKFY